MGYNQSRNFRRTKNLILKALFSYSHIQDNFCSSASGISKGFILCSLKKFKNKALLQNEPIIYTVFSIIWLDRGVGR